MITSNSLITQIEALLSSHLGGSTTLSDPTNNPLDPLVNIVAPLSEGLAELYRKAADISQRTHPMTACCEDIFIMAANRGLKTEDYSYTQAVFISTIIGGAQPAGIAYTDSKGNNWATMEPAVYVPLGFAQVGFAKVRSANLGAFPLVAGELQPNNPTLWSTNADVATLGYTENNCEEMRLRLAQGAHFESSPTILHYLNDIPGVTYASFTAEAPDCLSAASCRPAFIVEGGDPTAISGVIRTLSPVTHTLLVGDTGDADALFMRPSYQPVEVRFWGSAMESHVATSPCVFKSLIAGDIIRRIGGIDYLDFKKLDPTLPFTGATCVNSSIAITNTACWVSSASMGGPTSCLPLEPWELIALVTVDKMGDCV